MENIQKRKEEEEIDKENYTEEGIKNRENME